MGARAARPLVVDHSPSINEVWSRSHRAQRGHTLHSDEVNRFQTVMSTVSGLPHSAQWPGVGWALSMIVHGVMSSLLLLWPPT